MLSPAYIAGILDGEGSIFLREGDVPHVSVANVSRPLIEGLAELGGAIQDRSGRPDALGDLPIWEWTASGERAVLILRACTPSMVVKQDKAIIAVAAWDAGIYSMPNPRKRRTHIEAARAVMALVGWPVSGPDLSEVPCRHGHPMTAENTYRTKEGPVCRPCRLETKTRHNRKVRA